MENEKTFNLNYINLTKKMEIVEIFLITIGAFLTPFIIPQLLQLIAGRESFIATNSQYVVGTIVNIALILTGINIKGNKKIIGIITLPSISAICSGFIFKTASIYTVYMIPAIWFGNFALIYLYRKIFVEKQKNYILASIVAIIAKVAIIFFGFKVFSLVNIIPNTGKIFEALQLSMGINQLITATVAGMVTYGIIYIMKKREKTSN